MADNAIGLLETKGYVAAMASADAMVKAANVTIIGRQEVGDGLVRALVSPGTGAIEQQVGVDLDAARLLLFRHDTGELVQAEAACAREAA